MNINTQTILGVTFVLIALYLMLANADGTNNILRQLAASYSEAVRALQARS